MVVPQLGEEFDGEHPEQEGDGGHGEQRDNLFSHQADSKETGVCARKASNTHFQFRPSIRSFF